VTSLPAYYASGLPPAALVRGVEKDLRDFTSEEREEAWRSIEATDPTLARTVALVTAPSAPKAFGRWGYVVAKRLDGRIMGVPEDDVVGMSPERRLADVARALAPRLGSEDRPSRLSAENHLLLCLRALADRPTLDPLAALRIIDGRLGGDRRTAESRLRRELGAARAALLRKLADVAAVAEDRLAAAELEREDARRQLADLRRELEERRSALAVAEAHAKSLGEQLTEAREELQRQRETVKQKEQGGVLRSAELRGDFANFLEGDIKALLVEALEAVAEEPVAPDFARSRLEIALRRIEKEIGCLRPSSG